MTTGEVVGREAELAELDRFLDAVPSAPGRWCSRAEPGSAKRRFGAKAFAGRASARTCPCSPPRPIRDPAVLLRAHRPSGRRPGRGAATPALAATTRLGGSLSSGSRRGVECRLMRARSPSRFVASSPSGGEKRRPLVVAVDDLQWLDPPSASALEYAAQRLGEAPVGLLLNPPAESSGASRFRSPSTAPWPSVAFRARPAQPRSTPRAAARPAREGELLTARAAVAVPDLGRQSVFRPRAGAGALRGNDEALDPGAALPVPDRLHELLTRRLRAASAGRARRASRPVRPGQAEREGSRRDPRSMSQSGRPGSSWSRATTCASDHPLLAAAAYELADSSPENGGDPRIARPGCGRACRGARPPPRPPSAEQSEPVAAVLDEAASHAAARGAPYAAAELAELASSSRRTTGRTPSAAGASCKPPTCFTRATPAGLAGLVSSC